MKYGCIGERLGHSFSRVIHSHLADYKYELKELSKDELDAFMKKRDFLGINVTIPYKEAVIPYLSYIDDAARDIGAVNTVVNRGGKLYGYNTDFYGMRSLILRTGIDLCEKKVAILGTGGTSKTAISVAKSLGCREALRVSRSKGKDTVTYDELYRSHTDIEVIINTTPVGMFPNNEGAPVDISHFPLLSGVVDAVYNPIRTKLVSDALAHGASATGGLYMLVAQAAMASEIFTGEKYSEKIIEEVYNKVRADKENIVLIGMPASGKSTVGKIISKMTGKRLIDTDKEIERASGMRISEIFERYGEEHFRQLESEAVRSAARETSSIIATGGGAVLRTENVDALKRNGKLYFIDRPLKNLVPTADRPLGSNKEAIRQRYEERYPIYTSVCDVRIDADMGVDDVAKEILGDFVK